MILLQHDIFFIFFLYYILGKIRKDIFGGPFK